MLNIQKNASRNVSATTTAPASCSQLRLVILHTSYTKARFWTLAHRAHVVSTLVAWLVTFAAVQRITSVVTGRVAFPAV
jgi:hypothetical protein